MIVRMRSGGLKPGGRKRARTARPSGKVDAHDLRQRSDAFFVGGERDRRAAQRGQRAFSVINRNVGAEFVAEALGCGGDGARRIVARRNGPVGELNVRCAPAFMRSFADRPPERAHQKRDGDQARQQREIDSPEQPAADADHDSPSCFLANT